MSAQPRDSSHLSAGEHQGESSDLIHGAEQGFTLTRSQERGREVEQPRIHESAPVWESPHGSYSHSQWSSYRRLIAGEHQGESFDLIHGAEQGFTLTRSQERGREVEQPRTHESSALTRESV